MNPENFLLLFFFLEQPDAEDIPPNTLLQTKSLTI